MPRDFCSDVNELKIFDNISNSSIVLFYRDPTTVERMAYANESVQRKRNKVITRIPESRIKFGGIILTGFREGDFITKVNGKQVNMSSDPASQNYCADWKEQITTKAADLLMVLAGHVFDASAETEDADFEADEESAEKN